MIIRQPMGLSFLYFFHLYIITLNFNGGFMSLIRHATFKPCFIHLKRSEIMYIGFETMEIVGVIDIDNTIVSVTLTYNKELSEFGRYYKINISEFDMRNTHELRKLTYAVTKPISVNISTSYDTPNVWGLDEDEIDGIFFSTERYSQQNGPYYSLDNVETMFSESYTFFSKKQRIVKTGGVNDYFDKFNDNYEDVNIDMIKMLKTVRPRTFDSLSANIKILII